MPRATVDSLTRRVLAYFRQHAAEYGLDAGLLEVHYILNWGGFVNASYRISDGDRRYHLKLADEEDSLQRLERWRALSEVLTARYHAPRMLGWVSIPRTSFAGPLFEFVPGQPADLAARPDLLRGVVALLARLHADRDLAAALEALDGPPGSCADYFLSVYIDRFDEDLMVVAGDLPPFVSLDLLSWMMGETRELEGLARDLPAFQQPAGSPTHGDLWSSNILVGEDGQFSIIDWDDLALGDPALEFSILLGPFWRQGLLAPADLEQYLPPEAALRARFDLCLRALLLDQVIDTLADWVESAVAPAHQAEVRAEKERAHRAALEQYRRLYSS